MIETEEYPGWGGPRYYEPALKLTRADGNRDLVFRYVSHELKENELSITLKDIKDEIQTVLHYRVYPEYGILRRAATELSDSSGLDRVLLSRVQDAQLAQPAERGAHAVERLQALHQPLLDQLALDLVQLDQRRPEVGAAGMPVAPYRSVGLRSPRSSGPLCLTRPSRVSQARFSPSKAA